MLIGTRVRNICVASRLPPLLVTLTAVVMMVFFPGGAIYARETLEKQIKGSSRWIRVEPTLRWCGTRVVWLAAHAYGFDADFNSVLEISRPDGNGESSLADVVRALESTGLAGRAVRCEMSTLADWKHLALTVHRTDSKALHAFLYLGIDQGQCIMIDPFRPAEPLFVDTDNFLETWTGQAILIAKSQEELETSADQRVSTVRIMVIVWGIALVCTGIFFPITRRKRRSVSDALLMLPLFTILSVGCGHQKAATSVELLRFDRTEIDVGTVFDHSPVKGIFHFCNIGNRPIQIVDVRAGCACTSKQFPVEIIPQNSDGNIILESNLAGRRGDLVMSADVEWVRVGEEPQPQPQRITIRCTVVPAVSIAPQSIAFTDVTSGVESVRSATLRRYRGTGGTASMRPNLRVVVDSPDVRVSLSPAVSETTAGVELAEYVLTATWTPKIAGVLLHGRIQISEESESAITMAEIPLSGFAVHPSFSVSPRVLVVDGKAPSTLTIKVVHGIEPDDISCEAVEDGADLIMTRSLSADKTTIQIDIASRRTAQRVANRRLRVQTNTANSPQYFIPVVAIQ